MARAPMPAPQMIETPAMRRSAALAKALEDLRAPPQQIGGYGDLGARLLAQGITQWSKGRADKAVEGEKTAMRDQFLAGLPVAPEALPSSNGPALAALLAPTPTNTQEPQQADIAPVAPVMGSPMPPAAPAGMPAAPVPMADAPPMPQAPAPAPAPQAAPAGGQMPPQLAAYIRQMAQTDLPGAQAVYGQWQQQQAMMSQLPDAIRNDPVAAWAATQAPAEVAESYGMRYRPTTTAAGSITSYGPGQNDPRVGTPVIERFDDRYGAIDPLNTGAGAQYTAPRGMTEAERTDRYRVENPTVPANSRVVNLPTGQTMAEGYIAPEIANVAPGGEALVFNNGQLQGRVASTQERPASPAMLKRADDLELALTADETSISRVENALALITDPDGPNGPARAPVRVGPVENYGASFLNATGQANENSLGIAQLITTAESLRQGILNDATGPQTEGDALRALNSILAGRNDPDVIRQGFNDYLTAKRRTAAVRRRQLEAMRGGGESAAPTSSAGPRPRATNPQTGETVEFDGQAWVPVR